VILAGSVVRTTQSGMGCPDWPHCFGKLIPPLSAADLPADYQKYLDKQNIDKVYNPFHAWTEYINRLLTGLLGVWIFVHVIWSFKKFYRSQQNIFWWSASLLLLTAFEAWLGKIVVDSNLAVFKITAHMLPALAVAAVPVIILNKINNAEKIENKQLKIISTITLILVLIQIILGTEVRSQIDVISQSFNYVNRELWIGKLDNFFMMHIIFSFIVSIICIYLFWRALAYQSLHKTAICILIFVLSTMFLGMIMAFLHIPAFAQPLHLLFSSLLIISLLAYRLKIK